MTLNNPIRLLIISSLVLAGVALAIQPGEAHKAITSKYTFNDDVFPILRDRCASCHVAGGIATMSLMTYDEAFPWAESIRAELVAAHMPPWNADEGYGAVKRAHTLTPKYSTAQRAQPQRGPRNRTRWRSSHAAHHAVTRRMPSTIASTAANES